MTKAINRELVVRGLLNEDDTRIEMYHYDAVFHAQVDTLAIFMEQVVDGFEASARLDGSRRTRPTAPAAVLGRLDHRVGYDLHDVFPRSPNRQLP